jgi:hypothetical protein
VINTTSRISRLTPGDAGSDQVAAAPYFYLRRRGRYANLLERLALRAGAKKLGLWGRPHTPYDPNRGVSTRR